ncbi:peptidase M23 [Lysobacteraceae bacterium NML120232]|nr:peptidase M23 [Xanthomonadaceae bacterium NML120232]
MKPGRVRLGLSVVLTFSVGLALAQDMRETERKLQQLRGELQQLGQERRRLEGERGEAARALREADEAIARSNRTLAETGAAITRDQARLAELEARSAQLEKTLVNQRQTLARLVRAAYLTGPESALKVMLSQDQIQQGQRDLVYYAALQRQRAAQIRQISEQLHQAKALEQEIAQHQSQLADARKKQQAALADVERLRRERAQLLGQIDSQYQDKREREQALGQDAAALERLLAQLREAAARAERERREAAARARREQEAQAAAARREQAAAAQRERNARRNSQSRSNATHPAQPANQPRTTTPATPRPAPISSAAPVAVGGAGWPLNGSLLAGFGGTMPDGARSSGLLIAAAAGAPVRAVADGQVVFAEWMSGYGLLCIIDHGNGYMSLYAHNDALMKETGSRVRRGDTIGTVGNSGGQGRPALYFELRRAGRPVNPNVWLRP